MFAYLGEVLLNVALVATLLSLVLLLVAWKKSRTSRFLPYAVYTNSLCVTIAFLSLVISYVISDFSVLNVALNSHTAKPLLYKISGAWGNHEGSMLLWLWVLVLYSGVYALTHPLSERLHAVTLGIQQIITLGFLIFILLTSDPFILVFPVPTEGQGLNPVLQDIGLALHPPMLYLGYVGFSLPFSAAIAALLCNRADGLWAGGIKKWVVTPWICLTLGVGLGSWWAYRELGWGGFWFWDPVENASLMPWLAGTALLHALLVMEKREILRGWTMLLAILTFSLSLIGTFLVRSGVLTSVHAFANDPERGVFILILLGIIAGGGFLIFALKAPSLSPKNTTATVSRETLLLLGTILLVIACGVVFLGTLYPLFLEVLQGARVSVGPPYYDLTFTPIIVPILFLAFFTPAISWKQDNLSSLLRPSILPLVGLLAVAGGLLFWDEGRAQAMLYPIGFVALISGVWLIVGMCVLWGKRIRIFQVPFAEMVERAKGISLTYYAMLIAHIGFGVLVIAAASASLWQQEQQKMMAEGDSINVAGYRLELEKVEYSAGKNYFTRIGKFRVYEGDKELGMLNPEYRFYPVEGQQTNEADIYVSGPGLSDLYTVIGESREGQNGYAVRVYYKPAVAWIWIGCILMGAGGAISLFKRKKKPLPV
ncbi:MAG: cytochrome c biosis protein CcmF [Rickettsiales bacterium]|jgi:cytochrome c-type biogenesis protein CcmF|nr:cytochrome c biosis protein CcmF [Rickettsiales bacterium]